MTTIVRFTNCPYIKHNLTIGSSCALQTNNLFGLELPTFAYFDNTYCFDLNHLEIDFNDHFYNHCEMKFI